MQEQNAVGNGGTADRTHTDSGVPDILRGRRVRSAEDRLRESGLFCHAESEGRKSGSSSNRMGEAWGRRQARVRREGSKGACRWAAPPEPDCSVRLPFFSFILQPDNKKRHPGIVQRLFCLGIPTCSCSTRWQPHIQRDSRRTASPPTANLRREGMGD